jgi:hypothetical protein
MTRATGWNQCFSLWFVFGRLFALVEPEFKKSFRLRNVLQSERSRQAILIRESLLSAGVLKYFPREDSRFVSDILAWERKRLIAIACSDVNGQPHFFFTIELR